MADVPQTVSQLITDFADNSNGAITAQELRDFVMSVLFASNNLSDLDNVATARTNLGLGSAAQANSSAFDASGSAAAVNSTLAPEIAANSTAIATNTTNITSNTTAIAGKASLTGATFTGPVQATALLEKSITFTPSSTNWYRITSDSTGSQSGIIRIAGTYTSGSVTHVDDTEFHYDISSKAVALVNPEGSITIVRNSYNQSMISQIRIGADSTGTNTYLDIYAIHTGQPITVYGYGPHCPALITPTGTANSPNVTIATATVSSSGPNGPAGIYTTGVIYGNGAGITNVATSLNSVLNYSNTANGNSILDLGSIEFQDGSVLTSANPSSISTPALYNVLSYSTDAGGYGIDNVGELTLTQYGTITMVDAADNSIVLQPYYDGVESRFQVGIGGGEPLFQIGADGSIGTFFEGSWYNASGSITFQDGSGNTHQFVNGLLIS